MRLTVVVQSSGMMTRRCGVTWKPVKQAAYQKETQFFAVTDCVEMSDYPGRNVTLNPSGFNVLRTCHDLSLRPLTNADTLMDNANCVPRSWQYVWREGL